MEWKEVIDFWFKESGPEEWFRKSELFDAKVRDRFLAIYWQTIAGEKEMWRAEPKGRLAEIIVVDQFARNIFRGTAQSFAHDPLALALSQEAIRARAAEALTPYERQFLYMPFMHSESKKIHERAVQLFHSLGLPEPLKYELAHKNIIDTYGRYPHRNEVLGRASTPAELAFLKSHPGF